MISRREHLDQLVGRGLDDDSPRVTEEEWATYLGDLGEYRLTWPRYPKPNPD